MTGIWIWAWMEMEMQLEMNPNRCTSSSPHPADSISMFLHTSSWCTAAVPCGQGNIIRSQCTY